MRKTHVVLRTFAFLIVLVGVQGASCFGAIVVSDSFGGSALDPAWSITFEDATGWSHSVGGGQLDVTDITGAPSQPSGGSIYGTVKLTQNFGPIGDFQLQFDMGWAGNLNAMQFVIANVVSSTGDVVAAGGYSDAWADSTGAKYARAGALEFSNGAGTLPQSGNASLTIERTGSNISVAWNGAQFLAGTDSTPITDVELTFGYYNFSGGSTFGTEVVSFVELDGSSSIAAVPEPASLAIWGGIGIVGLIAGRRKWSKKCG
ncbi:MAG: hypothetical protein IAF94_18195 [Pirellulaceae bacterium]|nr:hypothetical protein [Pirellulaceae bacterium]